MTTTKKPVAKKAAGDPMVAAETILIEGKAFERGEVIKGVSKDELDRAATQRRAIKKSVFDAQGVPAPDLGSEDDDDADADEGEGAGQGEGEGSGE